MKVISSYRKICIFCFLLFPVLNGNAQTIINVLVDQPEKLKISANELFSQTASTTILGEQVTVSGGEGPFQYLWTNNGQVLGNTLITEVAKFMPGNSLLLTVTDRNNCSTTSNDILTEILEVRSKDLQFKIYPNPATNFIFIESGTPDELLDISIFNSIGQCLLQKKTENKSMIEINLAPGLYQVKIKSADEQSVELKKLIVL